MKPRLSSTCVFIALLTVSSPVAANWPSAQSTYQLEACKERAQFKAHRNEQHPWKKSMPLPTTLAEAGLTQDVKLVWTDSYLDGGTRGFLFKDSAGNYLAVCTGPGFQSKDVPNRIDAPVGSLLFIGGRHYSDPVASMAISGGACEDMLKALISRETNLFGEKT